MTVWIRPRPITAAPFLGQRRRPYPGGLATTDGPIDWIKVDRVIDGEQLPLNPAEAYHAARCLSEAGLGTPTIARLTGANARTVIRWHAAGYPPRNVTAAGTLGRPIPPPAAGEETVTSTENDWRHDAVCRDTEDTELFFPVGNTGPALRQAEEAKAHCRRCPVMEQCLQWALDTGQEAGVWGGRSEDERRTMTAAQPKQRRQVPAKCGTRGGYKKHVRDHTEICDGCRAANTAYGTDLYHRNKGQREVAA